MRVVLITIALALLGCTAQRLYTFPGERPVEYLVCEHFEHCKAWNINNSWNIYFYDLEKCNTQKHLQCDARAARDAITELTARIKKLIREAP